MENVNVNTGRPEEKTEAAERTEAAGKTKMAGKVGYFFLTMALAVLCVVMQIAAMFFILLPALVIQIANGSINVSDPDAYMSGYMELAQSCTGPGILLYHVLGLLLFGLWYKFSFKKPRPTIKGAIHNTTGKAVLLAVVCGAALCFFANATVVIENYLVPSIVESYMQMAEAAGMGVDVFTIVATVLLAPIGEEFLCRGLMLKYAKKSLGCFWAANILQAVLFGCIHANWVQGIYAFFIGLVLGWLVERYQTLLPAILLHFVVNFSSSTWVGSLFNAIYGEDMPPLAVGVIIAAAAGAVIVALMYWESRGRKGKNSQKAY